MKKVFKLFCLILALLVLVPIYSQEFSSGYKKTPIEELRQEPLFKFRPRGAFQLPFEVDLSDRLPIPGNQGTYQGSCVAWAIGYGLKSFHERLEENNPNIVHSPSFIYNQILRPVEHCNFGITFEDGLDFLKTQGSSELRFSPYSNNDCRTQPTLEVKERAKKYRILDSQLIYYRDDGGRPDLDVEIIKQNLALDTPVIIGIVMDRDFWLDEYGDRSQSARPYIWSDLKLDCASCYHAMLAVGYNDQLNAVKVMNSYGKDFGNDGFGWIDYDVFSKTVQEAYITLDDLNSGNTVVARREASSTNKNEVTSNTDVTRYDNWIKSGYYRNIDDDFRVSLIYLNKKEQEAIFNVYTTDNNTESELLGSLRLRPDESYNLSFEGKELELSLDRIGRAGKNPFKAAAFYSLEVSKKSH